MSSPPDRNMTRRDFCKTTGVAFGALALSRLSDALGKMTPKDRPNILWLVSEDNSPFLGCYGNELVDTPNLDKLASEGVLFENCHSGAPVCAPARATLITGMEPSCLIHSIHMRGGGRMPEGAKGFPYYLRQAGYWCANNGKTDYNVRIGEGCWDVNLRPYREDRGHWRQRPKGKPFFCQFNNSITHEGYMFPGRYREPDDPIDPAKVDLPAYHPDTETFRTNQAHYFDHMGHLDDWVGKILRDLEADGLAEDTIVFYFGDHGGVLPRGKRFVYNSGTRVPLIIRFPDKYRHLAPGKPGSRITAPVSFADFGPTALALAGAGVPTFMQGKPFAGPKPHERTYAYCYRGRMDERYDFCRAVKGPRYVYIRNYMPHVIYGQHIQYMFRNEAMQQWKKLYEVGKLKGPQKAFWEEKPAEELYDSKRDPDEVHNLADDLAYKDVLETMRKAHDEHMLAIRDVGFIPEGAHRGWRYEDTQDPERYNLEKLMRVAWVGIQRKADDLPQLRKWLRDEDKLVRYWAVMGCVMLGKAAAPAIEDLKALRDDVYDAVRMQVGEALCVAGDPEAGLPILERFVSSKTGLQLHAANALDHIGTMARPAIPAMREGMQVKWPDRQVVKALEYTVAKLEHSGTTDKEAKQ